MPLSFPDVMKSVPSTAAPPWETHKESLRNKQVNSAKRQTLSSTNNGREMRDRWGRGGAGHAGQVTRGSVIANQKYNLSMYIKLLPISRHPHERKWTRITPTQYSKRWITPLPRPLLNVPSPPTPCLISPCPPLCSPPHKLFPYAAPYTAISLSSPSSSTPYPPYPLVLPNTAPAPPFPSSIPSLLKLCPP